MKKPLLLLLCLFTVIGYAKDPHIKAVYALIERVTPGYGKQIKLQLTPPMERMCMKSHQKKGKSF